MEDNKNKKEEILERSRKSGKDEGLDFAEMRGNKIGVVIFAVIAFILAVFSGPDQIKVVYTIAALSFSVVLGSTFSMYRFSKKKIYLFGIAVSAYATVVFTLMVVL